MSTLAELLEDIRDGGNDRPYYETMIDQGEYRHGKWVFDWVFACNRCARLVDPTIADGACPDHAPKDVPGLARAECWAEPKHSPYWVLDGDHAGYGVPCPTCLLAPYREAEAAARQCRHWPWRRWKVTRWTIRAAYRFGVTGGIGGAQWGDGCNWCVHLPRLRGERTYLLGVRIKPRGEVGY